MKRADETPLVSPISAVLLLVISAAAALLSLFQWMELLLVKSGGEPICSVNDFFNCGAVWSTAFATRIHRTLGIPVAGLGLVWALTAFGLSVLLVYRIAARLDPTPAIAALRLTAGVGILACITFGAASARSGAVCLTCLATYAVVAAFGLVVVRLLPGPLQPSRKEFRAALLWSVGLAVISYLLLLGPGLKTAETAAPAGSMQKFSAAPAGAADDFQAALASYLQGLPAPEKQAVSDSIAFYRRSPAPPVREFEVRKLYGPADAPVKFVEFTDIGCSHCAHLIAVMKQLEQYVPTGKISVEARNFPLDGACNPAIAVTHPNSLSCLGAKIQICLENAPDFWQLREKLFAEQSSLSPERMLELGSQGLTSRAAIDKCVASPETEARLKEDIAYAMKFSPRGTPIVLINGREGTAVPSFLFAMAMSNANPNAPAFAALPPASSQVQ
jgi:serine/threonine-protein kinase